MLVAPSVKTISLLDHELEAPISLADRDRFRRVVVERTLKVLDPSAVVDEHDRLLLGPVQAAHVRLLVQRSVSVRQHPDLVGDLAGRDLIGRAIDLVLPADDGHEDALPQVVDVRLQPGAVRQSGEGIRAQHAQQSLDEFVLAFPRLDMRLDRLLHESFALDDLGPRAVPERGVAQPDGLAALPGDPGDAVDVRDAVRHDGQRQLGDFPADEAEPTHALRGAVGDHVLDELARAALAVGRHREPAADDGAAAALPDGLAGRVLAVVGQHGDAPLPGDAHPGAVGGAREVPRAEDVRARLRPPVDGGGWTVEELLHAVSTYIHDAVKI